MVPEPAAMVASAARSERRMAAIAVADVVGSSILVAMAPEAMQKALNGIVETALKPLAVTHGARLQRSTGDGSLVEFPSADAALAWALAVQRAVIAATADPQALPIALRISIDVGEVLVEKDDIIGQCVNIATRLQENAPPGGLAISEAAQQALSARPTGLVDIGIIMLRNIARPIRVALLLPETPPRIPRAAPLEGRPAIAVLPFRADGADEPSRYFNEGIIEDIILSLGALHEISVIARSATLNWSHDSYDPPTLGRMLGVRYLVSGKLQRRGDGLRLRIDLHETQEGDQLWTERFDIPLREIFLVQDHVVERVVAGVAPTIRAAELRMALRKAPESLSAYDHTLRAMHALDGLKRESFRAAEQHLQQAMSEDPGYATAAALAARWHSLAIGQAWSNDPANDAVQLRELAHRAVQLDPRNALGHAISGHFRAYHLRDPESALPYLRRAVEVGPSHALAWTLLSGSLSYLGRGDEALAAATRGFGLSPLGADRYYYQFFEGLAQHVTGDHVAAARSMRLSLAESPGFTSAHRILIACLVAQGECAAAQTVAAEMMKCEPRFRISRYAKERQPFADPTLGRQLLDALRQSGVPD